VNVIKARRARGDKSRFALVGLVPFFVTWTLIPVYLYLNPEILHNHLVPFVFFCGLVNAYSVGQIITAHLVHLDFPYYNVLILPLAYGVFDSLGPWLQRTVGFGWPSALGDGGYQVAYVFMMLGAAIGVYGRFVVSFSLLALPQQIFMRFRLKQVVQCNGLILVHRSMSLLRFAITSIFGACPLSIRGMERKRLKR
jgi:hypothetical protein